MFPSQLAGCNLSERLCDQVCVCVGNMTLAVEPSCLWSSRALHPFHLQHNTRRAACHENTLSHQRTTVQWNVILHRNEHFTSNNTRRCWSRFRNEPSTSTYSVCSTGKPFESHVGGVEKLLVIILSPCASDGPLIWFWSDLFTLILLWTLSQTPDWPTVPSGLCWIISSWKLFWKTVKSVFLIFHLDSGSTVFTPTLRWSRSWSTHTFLTLTAKLKYQIWPCVHYHRKDNSTSLCLCCCDVLLLWAQSAPVLPRSGSLLYLTEEPDITRFLCIFTFDVL